MGALLFVVGSAPDSASCRFRALWPAECLHADVVFWEHFSLPAATQYDACIFVKAGNASVFASLRSAGCQVWWDVCDPYWWWHPAESRLMAEAATGVVASNASLARDFVECCGVTCHVIPDRLQMRHYSRRRIHTQTNPVLFVWFGYARNRISLLGAIPTLQRLVANGVHISLTVCDERPEVPLLMLPGVAVSHVQWTFAGERDVLATHDLAFLPPHPDPWGSVKSNNKHLTAWACGLPTSTGMPFSDLLSLAISADLRSETSRRSVDMLTTLYRIEDSAADWVTLL